MRIQSLSFKAGNFKSLSGIQVHLTNGKQIVSSPLYKGDIDTDPIRHMHDISAKHISKVAVRVLGDNT